MTTKTNRNAPWAIWAALTVFVSAFLLFQVQPIISKKILPWFGGSPAVWTTCVLFFQLVLLAGYGYAHLLIGWVSPRWQGRVHAALLAAAALRLPILPVDWWQPDDGGHPAARILLLLAATVGPPYFLLAATGPLIQAWFARVYPGASPYRLYALSNVGSLGALLTYPFVFERIWTVGIQGFFWSAGFVLFALSLGSLGIWWERMVAGATVDGRKPKRATVIPEENVTHSPPTWQRLAAWTLLPAVASLALLAVTNHVSEDIAVAPFLWVIPLSLYLLSFIICFDREAWYSRKVCGLFAILLFFGLCLMEQTPAIDALLLRGQAALGLSVENPSGAGGGWFPFTVSKVLLRVLQINTVLLGEQILAIRTAYFGLLFFLCLLCHGELVRLRPAPQQLTLYYLLISAGGALGGLFVALLSPLLFARPWELPISLLSCLGLGSAALLIGIWSVQPGWRKGAAWAAAGAAGVTLLFFLAVFVSPVPSDAGHQVVLRRRNFYGSIRVEDGVGADGRPLADQPRYLYHGQILHGLQFLAESGVDEPTTYYTTDSGAGLAIREFQPRAAPGLRVAVVGLGAGTMAAYANAGDHYRFFEIDPKVIALHENDPYFTYIERARGRGAAIDLVLGDARISLRREIPAGDDPYDVIILDAFSGDAIPTHLLTAEAFEIYDRRLRRDASGENVGVIAIHTSNKYLDLEPVVRAAADQQDFRCLKVTVARRPDRAHAISDWMLVTRSAQFLQRPAVKRACADNEAEQIVNALSPLRAELTPGTPLEIALIGGRVNIAFSNEPNQEHIDLYATSEQEAAQTDLGDLARQMNQQAREKVVAYYRANEPANPAPPAPRDIASSIGGDHRQAMPRSPAPKYDAIILAPADSRALTKILDRGLLEMYERQFRRTNGLLLIRVDAQAAELLPRIRTLAKALQLQIAECKSPAGTNPAEFAATCVYLCRDGRVLKNIGRDVLWTDQYSNLFEILKSSDK